MDRREEAQVDPQTTMGNDYFIFRRGGNDEGGKAEVEAVSESKTGNKK